MNGERATTCPFHYTAEYKTLIKKLCHIQVALIQNVDSYLDDTETISTEVAAEDATDAILVENSESSVVERVVVRENGDGDSERTDTDDDV